MIEIRTGCDRCKGRFKVTEVDDSGYPLHPHHCDDCVKQCEKCKLWATISNFLPRLDSRAYEEWSNTRTHTNDSPLGILKGRDTVLDECMGCKPYRDPMPEIRVPVSDDVDRLNQLLEGLKSS